MKWQFRAATEADFAAICALIPSREELFRVYPRGQYPFTVEQVRHLSEIRKALSVLTDGNKVAGFANLYDFSDNQRAFIGNVVIDTGLRGQGLGRNLVQYMLKLAFSEYALHEVHISVFSDNTPALLLYSSLGFKPYAVEERRDYNNKKMALLHMKLARVEFDALS